MLEIKHLTKVYKTKGGSDTKALDDVSINFEETGLVFLLGKSGSGKSTLLNLAGGLDSPTSGEVIVMGKSSKDFTGSDFDSYRNTFVGFIFQEYNVLNEFSVEDNVALALELQGKPKDKQKIAELLRSVELEQYAKRKPNTLSGGQKQRIAIARALVKDPQIIMADEPTGALDSATGKQVFETLKKLSESRLVIVVSHDREFAEIYGDRIVELKDGKIISDVTKKKLTPRKLDENVTLIGENTLAVKSGEQLTEANFLTIKKFLSECGGSVVLTKGEQEIADFKRATRMDDDGAREHFEDTQEEELNIKQYDKSQTKFIRSRLPAAKAIKIGAAGLKLKPFRLVLTILLSFFAFVMFGLFSTMMVYDGDEVLVNSFMESDYEYVALSKAYRETVTYTYDRGTHTYNTSSPAKFTPAELNDFAADGKGFGVYGYNIGSPSNVSVKTDGKEYYNTEINKLSVGSASHPFASKLKTGAFPAADDEICVSSYLVDCIKNADFRILDADGKPVETTVAEIQSENDLIGKYLSFYNDLFKVTGVFDSGAVPAKYDAVKNNTADFLTAYTFRSYMEQSVHTLAFVTQKYIDDNSERFSSDRINYFDYASKQLSLSRSTRNDEYVFYNTNEASTYAPDEKETLPVHFFDAEKSTLTASEIVIPAYCLNSLYPNEPQLEDYGEGNEDAFYAAQEEFYNIQNQWQKAVDIVDGHDYSDSEKQEVVKATDEEYAAALAFVLDYYTQRSALVTVTGTIGEFDSREMKIVGFYTSDSRNQYGVYTSQSIYDAMEVYQNSDVRETMYVQEADAMYQYIFVPFEKDRTAFIALVDLLGEEHINTETDVFYKMENVLYNSVEMANDMVDTLSTVFLWVGIVLALFASLLLFNFISMSISNKKKEIGILRAVGARGTDVFKIFFSESGIIVGICTVLSLIGSFVLTGVINGILKADVGLDVTLFVFGGISVAMMLGVALAVVFISTFLPVYFTSKKKPVDSIRAL